jgi:hypothetical protein
MIAVFIEGSGNTEAISRAIAKRLGLPQASFSVIAGDERPLLASGKTDYASILALARKRLPSIATEPSAAERLEQGLAELFPGQRIYDSDTFAALGGDSLTYVVAASVIEEALGDLPAKWELLTLEELKEKARAAAAAPVRVRSRIHVEGEMIARCLAVTAVVVSHAQLPQQWFGSPVLAMGVRGGTDVLMLLFGFNVMRFQGPRLVAGRAFEVFKHHLTIFGIPYLALTALWFVDKAEFDVARFSAQLLLLSNYYSGDGTVLWFFEALLQMSVLLTLAFSSRTFVRAWQSWRWFPFAVVAIGAIAKVAAWSVYDPGRLGHRTPDALFFLFVAGLAFSIYRQRVAALLALLVVALELLTWGTRDTHAAVMAVCLAVMIIPRLTVPAWLGKAIFKMAASTFYIYIANPFVVRLFIGESWLGGGYPILCTFASVGAGLLLHTLVARSTRLAKRHQNRLSGSRIVTPRAPA